MSKKLIAYFSASGTTKKVAEMISHLDSLKWSTVYNGV